MFYVILGIGLLFFGLGIMITENNPALCSVDTTP